MAQIPVCVRIGGLMTWHSSLLAKAQDLTKTKFDQDKLTTQIMFINTKTLIIRKEK